MKKRILATLLACTLTMTSVPTTLFAEEMAETSQPMTALVESQTTTPAAIEIKPTKYVGDGYEVAFNVANKWPGAFQGELILTNTSDEPLENWTLAYDFEHEITNMWNAQIITHEANSYIIKNVGHNQDIAPGSSVNIGFQANWNDEIKVPKSYDLLIAKQEVGDTDYTIDFKVTGDWGQAFNGEISITNNTEETIEDWTLEFDFDRNIERFWTAEVVEHEGEHYIIKNAEYNANIASGQTIILGFAGNPGNVDSEPTNYVLNQLGQEIDYEKDTDGDGVPDWFEKELGTDTNRIDTDGDGLPDGYEYFDLETDPLKTDTDGNGILDGDEDFDEDKLTNIEEFNLKTNPLNKDTDRDRLSDSDEVKKFFTNPLVYDEIDMTIDSDEDGLFDGLERILGTNEFDSDTDRDGLTDYYEYFVQKTDPLKVDTNGNGISDADEDSDKDGLNNLEEYINKTNPFQVDTDYDGLSDEDEVGIYQTNPTLEDTDGDTLSDGDEIKIGLDPLKQYTFTDIHDSKYIINQLIQPIDLPEINTEDNIYELSISITGNGNIKDNLLATESIATDMVKDNRAIVGKVAQLSYDKFIEKATLYFKMDESKCVNESTLFPDEEEFKGVKKYQIFRYDYEMNLLYPIYTKHDIENNVVYSEVTQLGDYCIIDMEKWLYDVGLISPINNRVKMLFNDFDESIEKEEISNDTYHEYEGISVQELEKLVEPEIMAFNATRTSTLNKQADVVFVIDSTGSMGSVISSVKTNISNIIGYLRDKNITLHVSFVEYRDITTDGLNSTKVHSLNGSNWLYSTQDMINILGSIRAGGGGDIPETVLDALGYVEQLTYRTSSYKFAIIFTDADYKVDNTHNITNITEISSRLATKGISTCVVTPSYYSKEYVDLFTLTDGKYINLYGDMYTEIKDFIDQKMNSDEYYTALVGSNLVTGVLKEKLVKGGSTDTDEDGLTDSEEVNWDYIDEKDGIITLPLLSKLLELFLDTDASVLDRFSDIINNNKGTTYTFRSKSTTTKSATDINVLPTNSNPWNKDTDGDGILDKDERNNISKVTYNETVIKDGYRLSRTIANPGNIHTFIFEPTDTYNPTYKVYTEGSTDTYMNLYKVNDYSKNISKLIASDDNSGQNNNCEIITQFPVLKKGGYKIKVMHSNLSSGTGKYDILLKQTGIYEEAGFKDGDYIVLYAIDNRGKAHPFLAQLKTNTVTGVLVPNLEDPEGYYEHTATLTPAQVASVLIGISPADMAKDIADFAAGKDIFTGDDINRWLLAACVITPEIMDQGIKAYGKNADVIAGVIKNGGKKSLFNWNLIKATQPLIEGTNVPKSFIIRDLFVNNNEVWVGGNATKHIGEFVISANKSGGGLLAESEIMKSFINAATEAAAQTLKKGDNRLFVKGWEIGINGETGVIYHALMK